MPMTTRPIFFSRPARAWSCPELQKGVIPPFIAEKDAVTAYARLRGEPEGIHIYRDGEHHYSYTLQHSITMYSLPRASTSRLPFSSRMLDISRWPTALREGL